MLPAAFDRFWYRGEVGPADSLQAQIWQPAFTSGSPDTLILGHVVNLICLSSGFPKNCIGLARGKFTDSESRHQDCLICGGTGTGARCGTPCRGSLSWQGSEKRYRHPTEPSMHIPLDLKPCFCHELWGIFCLLSAGTDLAWHEEQRRQGLWPQQRDHTPEAVARRGAESDPAFGLSSASF